MAHELVRPCIVGPVRTSVDTVQIREAVGSDAAIGSMAEVLPG